MSFSLGNNLGWFSPALPVLKANPGPLLDGPVSQQTAGWLASSTAIGAICGCLSFGLIANWIGYKKVIMLSSFPLIVNIQFGASFIIGEFIWNCSSHGCSLYSGTIRGTFAFPDFYVELL